MTERGLYSLEPVGVVRSELRRRADAPRQASEGAPDAWLEIDPRFAEALDGIEPGAEVIVLTWLHLANRSVLKVHPRGERNQPFCGVFATRSPDRPNPIGLHQVTVRGVDARLRLRVGPMEALDGTPVLDIKPVLPGRS